ncbi:hypothetical protein A2U01_0088268, partial [Trifolium medium]|nr:hypothetical protein [Trifolium medium]
ATPPRFHPSGVVQAAATDCFYAIHMRFRVFRDRRLSATVVAT